MDKNLGLGKGLSALMGEDYSETIIQNPLESNALKLGIVNMDIQKLVPSPFQPRRVFDPEALKELENSIRKKGVLQPLLVRVSPQNPQEYEIIAGERRFRAAQQVGLKEVPVIVKDFNDKEAFEVAIIENLQREDLNPVEEAAAYKRLLNEYQYTQEELAHVIGKSRSHVANMMRLLDLPKPVLDLLESKALSAGHARALLGAADAEQLARQVIRDGLNVRETEKLAARAGGKKTRTPPPEKDKDIASLEEGLSQMLKTKVSIKWTGKAGSVTIAYDTPEKLDFILNRLTLTGTA
ncbi:MAG: ParB/RepB/Spo0J family partition protein [Alphaproteobacteria bacterium]|nr:ParB/RepB/Spo0J family partition protein [Alphaproteobacteria bacterium]